MLPNMNSTERGCRAFNRAAEQPTKASGQARQEFIAAINAVLDWRRTDGK
jgi:hypothetical protein